MTAAPPRKRPAPVVAAAPRLAARARAERSARRGRRLRRGAQVLLGLAAVAGLAWVLLGSRWLAVDRVEVLGAARLTPEQVRAAVDLAPGTPLARVDLAAVARDVRALPPVAAVEVERSWPGTLRVQVTERVPAAGVPTGGRVTLLDAGGVAFASVPALPKGLVRLEVPRPGPQDPVTRAALAVHREVPAPLRARVRALRADSPSGVVLVLDGGKRVVWGSPGGAATKAAAATALLRLPGSVVDVSAPGVVTRR